MTLFQPDVAVLSQSDGQLGVPQQDGLHGPADVRLRHCGDGYWVFRKRGDQMLVGLRGEPNRWDALLLLRHQSLGRRGKREPVERRSLLLGVSLLAR